MREKSEAILLPRSSHPTRDSYLLIARPEGCWPLELGMIKQTQHHMAVYQSLFRHILTTKPSWKLKFDKGLLIFIELKKIISKM